MSKKLSIYLFMLAIGCTFLALAILIDLPEKVKWLFLAIAVILNVTSAAAAMKFGLQQMKPDKR
ncbi:hypothetical protein [Sporosarcina obsidiansis]|uniref:hypothetical protein n=1 Tax=Sporosarcina obsidiansis TaxID=2660748 RepID=UPI00129B2BD8|nr:hypothetical protein [Sporosarcina obsidiansis]